LIAFEHIKNGIIPESFDGIDFRKLSSLNIPSSIYKEVVKFMSWTTLRMNLNAIAAKGIFTDDKSIVDYVSNKLSDENEVLKSKVFPYQLYTTFQNLTNLVPIKIKNALQIAVEYSTKNIPTLNNEECLILLDISSSMNSPITGNRGSVTTRTTNMDAAAVLTASLLRKNPNSQVITFNENAELRCINNHDSIMTIANTLSQLCSGGTNVSSSLHYMNTLLMKYKNIIMISDNQSWMDSNDLRCTNSLYEWNKYTKRVKDTKMVCLNITPYTNTQIPDRDNVLNIGGFSDQFFTIIDEFFRYGKGRDRWVKLIEKIDLPT
jgi:60 kDa SS-A/Ro ribonucleoprotein